MASGPRRRADVACGTSAWMRHGTEGTWQSHAWPMRGAGGADMWQEATQTGPRGRPVGAPRGIGGFAYGGSTGIVGPGKKLGAVTQMRYRAPIFKHTSNINFFCVGLCPTRLTFCRSRGRRKHRIPSRGRRSRGPESTRSSIKHVRDMHFK